MKSYRIAEVEISPDDEGYDRVLEEAYQRRDRARCLCRQDTELFLYITRRHDQLILARWPGSGAHHAVHCDHYEAPDFLTGLGQVRGSAVVDDEESGETRLKLGFPMSRGAARSAPASLTNDKPDVKSTGQRLTIRGLLHYLWDRAELTHWHPRMAGKRNWYIVRRELLQAAHGCKLRGESLGQRLFVPEIFRSGDRDAIVRRQNDTLAPALASRDTMMIVIGEVRAVEPARFGDKLLVKHLANKPLMMDRDMTRRFHKRFAIEEQLWQAYEEQDHLVMAASFSIDKGGFPQLCEVSLMPVTAEWLPYENLEERSLLRKAVDDGRRLVKGLRVNLGTDKPIASITLSDTGDVASAIHLARTLPDPAYDEALTALMQAPGIAHAMWRSGESLPPPVRRGR